MGGAVASYRAAERATTDAHRALASALSSSDPSAGARAKRRLEAAEEAKRAALQECAAGLLHGAPKETAGGARRAPEGAEPRVGVLAKTMRPAPTERPATTGASLQGLALQLRQTRRLVERVKQTASDLQDLAGRPGVPEDLRREAGAKAAAVEEAIQAFRRGVGASDAESATHAARFVFEQRVMSIVADHQSIHLALAALSNEPAAIPPEKPAAPTAPKRRR
jgi:hypothetical protein